MKKLLIELSIAMTALGLAVSCWANPCLPIAQACKQKGYQRSGPVGKRLIKDCVIPIAKKSKTLPNITFTEDALQQCAALIAKKMSD